MFRKRGHLFSHLLPRLRGLKNETAGPGQLEIWGENTPKELSRSRYFSLNCRFGNSINDVSMQKGNELMHSFTALGAFEQQPVLKRSYRPSTNVDLFTVSIIQHAVAALSMS